MKKIFLIILLLSLMGCTCGNMKAYVSADKATFEVIAPEYESFVQKSNMDDAKKKRRINLLKSWKIRIREGESGGE